MTESELVDQSTHVTIPKDSGNDDRVPPWMLVVLILVICIPVIITLFFTYRKPVPQQPANVVLNATPTEVPVALGFSGDEFIRGWYWGETKKFNGTPTNWEYMEINGKHCWHSPRTMCK